MNMRDEYNYLKKIRKNMKNPSERTLKDYYNARNYIGAKVLEQERKNEEEH